MASAGTTSSRTVVWHDYVAVEFHANGDVTVEDPMSIDALKEGR